jgi:antitoxin MazE
MKARLVRIGDSRGIRLPEAVIEQAGLTDEVELEVRGAMVVITAAKKRARAGWAEAARELRSRGADRLLDPATPTAFEETEWQW